MHTKTLTVCDYELRYIIYVHHSESIDVYIFQKKKLKKSDRCIDFIRFSSSSSAMYTLKEYNAQAGKSK